MPYGPRLSEHELRARIRQCIDDGRLPVALSQEMAAGYGSRGICDGCGEHIDSDHVEYEVTDPRDDSQLLFHLSCHAIWQLECLRRMAGSEASMPSMGSHGPSPNPRR